MSLIQNWHNSIEAKPFLNSLLKESDNLSEIFCDMAESEKLGCGGDQL